MLYLDLTPVTLITTAQQPSTFTVTTNAALEHAGLTYLNVFSADPLNASNPYLGGWFGLHIAYDDVIFYINAGFPPFVGTLDALGYASASLTLPLPLLAGLQIFGVSTVWDLSTGIYTGFSPITAFTF
ncbi:MAG: hypothetical protein EXS14_03875 [Planctomycetes bacterium]|nr:hypothetical protein [Planctomycetota bacterium]